MTDRSIGIGFVFFRTTNLEHLDAAWLTLSKQDFTGVSHVVFLDNNTEFLPSEIESVLNRYALPVPRVLCFSKHGDATRTQSWSMNRVLELVQAPWIFVSRSDFLLSYDCLGKLRQVRDNRLEGDARWQGFVTSYCHQMGYDDALSNTDALAPYSLPDAAWRHTSSGPSGLVGHVPAYYFHTTDQDAGVWLTRRAPCLAIGGHNERMVAWGYQQQEFQRRLRRCEGVAVEVLPEYLFHHQHHWAPRDFHQAGEELRYER